MLCDDLQVEIDGPACGGEMAEMLRQAKMAQALCAACVEEMRDAAVQPPVASAALIRHGAQIALGFGTPAGVAAQLRNLAEVVESGAMCKPPASNSSH